MRLLSVSCEDKTMSNAGTQENFGAWLRQVRRSRDLTLEELASRSGVSTSYLSELERNYRAKRTGTPMQPSTDVVDALADALGVSREEARTKAYLPAKPKGKIISRDGTVRDILSFTPDGLSEPVDNDDALTAKLLALQEALSSVLEEVSKRKPRP